MRTCIYLRKSRADIESGQNEGETLSRHMETLINYTKEHSLEIADIKQEIRTGDKIACRPEMMSLLKEVSEGAYDGVLVMDLQRLCRGDAADQNILINTFKSSNTVIITPRKTYDLNNEADETCVEYETFIGRQEYKFIKRRFNAGRIENIMEGNYPSPIPPYGYDIVYDKKTRYLKINPEQANVVFTIFDMYSKGVGTTNIAHYLNRQGYKSPKGIEFKDSTIRFILKNPTYAGNVTWKKRKEIRLDDGIHKKCTTLERDNWIVVPGKHEPIVSRELYDKCISILNGKYRKTDSRKIANPFAGLIVCGICSHKMVVRSDPRNRKRLSCIYNCGNMSHKFCEIEPLIISELEKYYKDYIINIQECTRLNSANIRNIASMQSQLNTLEEQLKKHGVEKEKLFDDLELGKCDVSSFSRMIKKLDEKIAEINEYITLVRKNINDYRPSRNVEETRVTFRTLLDAYKITDNPTEQKEVLYKLLNKIEYIKDGDGIKIKIFPKLDAGE